MELYGDYEVISWGAGYKCDHRQFWLSELTCIGDEANIRDCGHLTWGMHNCNHEHQCVKVYCVGGGP